MVLGGCKGSLSIETRFQVPEKAWCTGSISSARPLVLSDNETQLMAWMDWVLT